MNKSAITTLFGVIPFLILTGLVFSNGIGNHLASYKDLSKLQQAIEWNHNAFAEYKVAFFTVDSDARKELLISSIQHNPSNSFAILQYVLLASAAEDSTKNTDALVEAAAQLRPVDGEILTQAAAYWLEKGQILKALNLWSEALSITRNYDDRLFPFFQEFLRQEMSSSEYDSWIGSAGSWWPRLYRFLARNSENLPLLESIFEKRRLYKNAVSDEEQRVLISFLIEERSWDRAYLYWLNSLDDESRKHTGLLFNGGFEHKISNYGFGWHIRRGHAYIETAYIPGVTGRKALHIIFRDDPARFQHISQLTRLLPGEYVLNGRYRAQTLRAVRGVQWRLDCVSPRYENLGRSSHFVGNSAWETFSMKIEIQHQCDVQKLSLVADGRNEVEQRVKGELWFDQLEIKRL
ncbi:MAG: hypothetical protein OEZ43_10050 [Gammaproteobacteria bacterium]|nr:hypothetical protein [Gammaproteobacteria bacterium]